MDKQTLRQYRYLVKEIEQLSEAQERLAAGMIGAVNINDMPRSNSIIHDRMAETACKMVELQYIIAERLNKAVAMRDEIEQAIAKIDDAQCRCLIQARYIDCKSWEQIAVDMFYSIQHIWRIHGRALEKMRDNEI